MGDQVTLRPVTEDDLAWLASLRDGPAATGVHEWFGWRDPQRRRKQWAETGLLGENAGTLVVLNGAERVGHVSWYKVTTGPIAFAWGLGILVAAEFRGRGYGTEMRAAVLHWAVMVLGGGGVGASSASTTRTDSGDLRRPDPHLTPGAALTEPTRYLSAVILPDDTVLTTGGSRDYRGRGASDNHIARIYDPTLGSFRAAALPRVGRDYHSEALLLPDGRVVVLGSNPLYGDQDNRTPGRFAQRIEIYPQPYLYQGSRPALPAGPSVLPRGGTAEFRTPDPDASATAKLLRPSAVTTVSVMILLSRIVSPGRVQMVPNRWSAVSAMTKSPSANSASSAKVRLGRAVRYWLTTCLKPSMPGTVRPPGRWNVWFAAMVSSTTARFPLFQTSAMVRRTRALFSSVDLGSPFSARALTYRAATRAATATWTTVAPSHTLVCPA